MALLGACFLKKVLFFVIRRFRCGFGPPLMEKYPFHFYGDLEGVLGRCFSKENKKRAFSQKHSEKRHDMLIVYIDKLNKNVYNKRINIVGGFYEHFRADKSLVCSFKYQYGRIGKTNWYVTTKFKRKNEKREFHYSRIRCHC